MLDGHETIGLNLRNIADHAREVAGGDEGLVRVRARMPEASRRTFEDLVLASEWYPLEHHLDFYRAVTDELLGGDVGGNFEVGLQMARRNMAHFSKIFLREGDPFYIIERGAMAWQMFHRPSEVEASKMGDDGARIRIVGFALRPSDRPFAESLRGHFTALMGFSGAEGCRVHQTRCLTRGDEVCEYEARWDAVRPGTDGGAGAADP